MLRWWYATAARERGDAGRMFRELGGRPHRAAPRAAKLPTCGLPMTWAAASPPDTGSDVNPIDAAPDGAEAAAREVWDDAC